MILAILAGLGLLVGIGALSLLSGALNFLFVKPKIEIIAPKTEVNPMQFDSLLYEQNKDKKLK